MTRKRIGRHIGGGSEGEEERTLRERRESLREAWSHWASGVTVLATRAGGRVQALTVSSFFPLSLDPPLVLTSLGPNAAALPFLEPGTGYAISILAGDQQRLASRYADTFPVGPDPFPASGPPVIEGALATLVCTVDELIRRGDHTLVVGRVEEATSRGDGPALAHFRRAYHTLG